MIKPSTIQFLKALKKNNNREWFLSNKSNYDNARSNFLSFVEDILRGIQKKDPTIADIEPKQCVFRMNRDVRFSKNKEPYKTNFGASISRGGKKIENAGYYFHLEPGASFIGGGLWMPSAPILKQVRQEIDYCFSEFSKIIHQKKFKNNFIQLESTEKLVRPPKNYDLDNPAIEFIKLKSFVVLKPLSDKELLEDQLVKDTIYTFETLTPLLHFLNRAILQ